MLYLDYAALNFYILVIIALQNCFKLQLLLQPVLFKCFTTHMTCPFIKLNRSVWLVMHSGQYAFFVILKEGDMAKKF